MISLIIIIIIMIIVIVIIIIIITIIIIIIIIIIIVGSGASNILWILISTLSFDVEIQAGNVLQAPLYFILLL